MIRTNEWKKNQAGHAFSLITPSHSLITPSNWWSPSPCLSQCSCYSATSQTPSLSARTSAWISLSSPQWIEWYRSAACSSSSSKSLLLQPISRYCCPFRVSPVSLAVPRFSLLPARTCTPACCRRLCRKFMNLCWITGCCAAPISTISQPSKLRPKSYPQPDSCYKHSVMPQSVPFSAAESTSLTPW